MSEDSIAKGENWSTKIGTSLAEHQIGVICVTPENYQSPWLLFEAGALSKVFGQSRVCPLLLGMAPCDLEGPLEVFQSTVFEKEDVFKLVKSLNEELGNMKLDPVILKDSFDKFWPDLEKEVEEVAKVKIVGTISAVMSAVKALAKFGLPEPRVGSLAYFSSGFESHALYSTLTSIANKRLYVFGRKNRKLFDKEHLDFFAALPQKINNGFDFRLLFLNPEAPSDVLHQAHQDDTFKLQLETNIAHVRSVMKRYNLDASLHCRKYALGRQHAMIIADDAVVYTRIEYDSDERAVPLTKAPFNVLNSTSIIGAELVEDFISTWEISEPL
jgi:hypothetical protein